MRRSAPTAGRPARARARRPLSSRKIRGAFGRPFFWSPAALLSAVLLFEPALQRREIFEHWLGRHFTAAGESLKRIGPRFRRARRKHLVQPGTDFLVAIEAAAVERPLPARQVAGRLVELELQDAGEEVARIGRVPRNVELGARIEILLRAWRGRGYALVLLLQPNPRLVVV